MKKKNFLLSLLALFFLLDAGYSQIVNGDFETNPTTPQGWTVSVNNTPAIYNGGGGPGYWVDLTGSGWGNGGWIEQTVATIPGHHYLLKFDLGCANGQNFTDAGANLEINGTLIGRFAFTDFTGTGNNWLKWKRFQYCFVATQNNTTVRFVGNGAATALTPAWAAPNPSGPNGSGLTYIWTGVIGLDNVLLTDEDNLFGVDVTLAEECNKYCFTLSQTLLVQNSVISFGNAQWYVDNIPESIGNTYCRRFPKNVTKIVKVVFTVLDSCGTHTQTLTIPITATLDCPCDLQSHTQIVTTFTPCNSYMFTIQLDPGYINLSTQWIFDNQLISGSLTSLSLPAVSAGTHTICAMLMGGLEGESGNLCCAKICTIIIIPPIESESRIIQYCPITYPLGPWYNPCYDCNGYYEFYKNGVLIGTSANGCISYVIDAPAEMRCYDVINGVRCLRKDIFLTAQALTVNAVQSPDVTYTICNTGNQITVVPYIISCGASYPNYEFYGPNNFYTQGSLQTGPVTMNLAPGDYTVDCVNYTTCSKNRTIVHVILQSPIVSECSVFIESCSLMLEPENQSSEWYYTNLLNCPDCKATIMNASQVGPWVPVSVNIGPNNNSGGYRVLQRTYIDPSNCRKCILTATVANANSNSYTLATNGQPCITLHKTDLIACMQNKSLKLFLMGHPETATSVDANIGITLCCQNENNDPNPTYYLYSEDDPCCFMIITLNCSGPQSKLQQAQGQNSSGENTLTNSDYKLVPNPTSSVFRIESPNENEIYTVVEIRDMTGKVLLTKKGINSQTLIDMSKFNKGTYFVNVTTASQFIPLKLILVND